MAIDYTESIKDIEFINVFPSMSGGGHVFLMTAITDKGNRVYRGWVYRLVKENLSQVVTLKKCSPHVLRHTFATVMLNNEAGLEAVKELMGHESVSTTQIYTNTTFEKMKKYT